MDSFYTLLKSHHESTIHLTDEHEAFEEMTLTHNAHLEDPDSSPSYSMAVIMDMIDKEHLHFRNSEVGRSC